MHLLLRSLKFLELCIHLQSFVFNWLKVKKGKSFFFSLSLKFWCSLETTKSCCPELSLANRHSLSIPFKESFDINFAERDFSLLAKPQFYLSPPVPKKVPKWSLDHALESLQTPRFRNYSASL